MRKTTRARWAASAAVAALAVGGLSGCAPHRLSGSCGIVIDGTGSSDVKTGFNAQQQIKDHVPSFLTDTGCRDVSFAPIGGSSRTTRCHQDPVNIDPEIKGNVDRKAVWAAERALVVKRADALRECVRAEKEQDAGSDILGGLAVIVTKRPTGNGSFPVLVISDFLEHDKTANLYRADLSTPAARARLIDKLAKEGRIPDMSGIQITAAGYGVLQSSNPSKFTGFDLFWRQLLKERAKAADPLTIL